MLQSFSRPYFTNDHNKLAFVPSSLSLLSLMFLGKARSRCFTWEGSDLTRERSTRLERLARGKHSNLLLTSVNYGRKRLCNIGLSSSIRPGANVTKLFSPVSYDFS